MTLAPPQALRLAVTGAIGGAMSSATAAMGSLLSNRTGAKKAGSTKPAVDDGKRPELQARFVDICSHFLKSRAFSKWSWDTAEHRHKLELISGYSKVLTNPFLAKGWNTWLDAYAEQMAEKRRKEKALSHFLKQELHSGFAAFERVHAAAKRAADLKVLTSVATRELERPRMHAYFDTWHEQQMLHEFERHVRQGTCSLIGYWLRTSCGRCACREISVPPDAARRLRAEGMWWI